jgi:threonine/homoserine/homoserine lactone efflux protein
MTPYLAALIGFTVAGAITPGPNNVIIASIGARRGALAAFPYMLGVALGFAAMILLVGTGLAGVLTQAPRVAGVLRWAALAWIALLAWQIAVAPLPGEGSTGRVPGFMAAVFFQWVNPKGWLIALSLTSAWIRPDRALLPQVALFAAVFAIVALPCTVPWALLGSGAAGLLHSPMRLRVFNIAMALLLVVSMLPVVVEAIG